jgi:hypothetical protein
MINDHTDWCSKGILVKPGGKLVLNGVKGVPESGVSWTHLSAPAGPIVPGAKVQSGGTKTLKLAKDVTQGAAAWKANDWIAVATTSFSPFETEFVQIDTLKAEGGGTTVTLKQDLKHYHFGSADPGKPSADNYGAGPEKNYGVDERAEVGLISRSIKLTAQTDTDNPTWGGEIKILENTAVTLQGVELEKFSKARLGSYPIHLHVARATGTFTINANSIHHSYNKCVTIHSTQSVLIQNNVCARIIGHIFYQEFGDEAGVQYKGNLGLGAMSHNFAIADGTSADKKAQFWGGDNLAGAIGYNGFNVPNTDAQNNPVRGTCARLLPSGELAAEAGQHPYWQLLGACPSERYYFEPASGFWIINPTTLLEDNSIAGCQGVGRGYWYVVPQNLAIDTIPADLRLLGQIPIGPFKNNRVHGCFSGVYAESEYEVLSGQLTPTKGGVSGAPNVFTLFEGLTATRNRDRGIWIRPSWSVLRHGRLATNKASVILVSSGGLDGNVPGYWALLEQSVIVGVSMNNVDRWGPCPVNSGKGVGCVDLTTAAKDIIGDGYPLPAFNLLGYQIYDGPVRIFKDRFVNFNKDVKPHLTDADKTFLAGYNAYFQGFPPVPKSNYEGDAALGWFKANQSAYPNATITNELTFDNVTLRHEVFTGGVNYGDFQDGDRNTVVIDGDGSLSGLQVVDAAGNLGLGAVSLNNLGYNQAGNSVDECLAEGQQDADIEARPTALMSPHGVATLEFQAAYPPSQQTPPNPALPSTKQRLTFTKDSKDFCESGGPCARQTMELTSRNTQGIWEPKVFSGFGYTVAASPCSNPPQCTEGQAGIPKRVSVGLTDAIKHVISATDPFRVRLGICYTGSDGASHPSPNFTITRGYRSWGPGGGVNPSDTELQQYFNNLVSRYPKGKTETCHNLDTQDCVRLDGPDRIECKNLDPAKGCPGNGVTPVPKATGTCPAGTTRVEQDEQNRPACIYPKTTLTALSCSGQPKDCVKQLTDTTYYYDKMSGMLFLNVVQDAANAVGPSPIGSCPGDPACPTAGESYYACPAQGCIDYVIQLDDAGYVPGTSNCSPYETFAADEPTTPYKLVTKGADASKRLAITRVFNAGKDGKFPHYKAMVASGAELTCNATSAPTTDEDGGQDGADQGGQ